MPDAANNDGARLGRSRRHSFPAISVDEADMVGPAPEEDESTFRASYSPSGDTGFIDNRARRAPQGPSPEERFERQLQQAERKAYDQGFEEGRKAGQETATQEMAQVVQQFRRAHLELEKFRRDVYQSAEEATVTLAIAVARQILTHTLSVDKGAVLTAVKAALQHIVDQEHIRIRVNNADLETVRNALYEFSTLVKNVENIVFEGDDGIDVGGCQVETNFGDVDARIGSQLARIEETLRQELEKARFQR